MKRSISLTKPDSMDKYDFDLRDVVPIVVNTRLKQKDVFDMIKAGIDIKTQYTQIIELYSKGNSVAQIIEKLVPKPSNI